MITTEDNELLFLIEENNEEALLKLIEKYNPKINAIISKYKDKALQVGLDISDLYQEGLIGLFKAVKSFNEDKDATFKTYVTIVIERQIMDLLRINSRIKHKTLNDAISLDTFLEEENGNLHNVLEVDNHTPEITLIDEEEIEELKHIFTEFELKVYELKLDGKTNKEVSIILDKNIRSIENTIQRIKQKIKEKI